MDTYIDQPTDVRPGEQLDGGRLQAYLSEQLPELDGPLTVQQFPAGFSNLTYCLKCGATELVLRRAPFGNKVKSAHDMGREYRVLSKLSDVYSLAPRPYLFCDDETVMGADFYVMELRRGIILRKELPSGLDLDADTMRRLSESLIDNLAAMHRLDYEAAGLADLGRPDGYVRRQVDGWTKRYQNARTEEVPAMDRLAGWLNDDLPGESGTALIHNDYKYDNLVLDASEITRIVAVLDWEMTTVGDPLMDLGTSLAYWVDADDPPTRQQMAFGPTHLPGSLTRQELVERYEAQTGQTISGILFYYGYGLFKLAVIVQQIYARYARGHTQDKRFAGLNKMVWTLAESAMSAIESGEL